MLVTHGRTQKIAVMNLKGTNFKANLWTECSSSWFQTGLRLSGHNNKYKIALADFGAHAKAAFVCFFHSNNIWKVTPSYLKSLTCSVLMLLILQLLLSFACHLMNKYLE